MPGEVERLRAEVAAYRLLAVNEGWNWRMVDAYGHDEYLVQRIHHVDRIAQGTVSSRYDAAGYLAAALTQQESRNAE
jgi:hypothetical protein